MPNIKALDYLRHSVLSSRLAISILIRKKNVAVSHMPTVRFGSSKTLHPTIVSGYHFKQWHFLIKIISFFVVLLFHLSK